MPCSATGEGAAACGAEWAMCHPCIARAVLGHAPGAVPGLPHRALSLGCAKGHTRSQPRGTSGVRTGGIPTVPGQDVQPVIAADAVTRAAEFQR